MKVVSVVNSLEAGGAERICVGVSNAVSRAGIDSSIISLRPLENRFFNVDPTVKLSSLEIRLREAKGALKIGCGLKLLFRLRRRIQELKPDIVISHLDETNIYTLIATLGLGPKVVCVLQMHPSRSFEQPSRRNGWLPRLFEFARALTYRFATRIVALAPDQIPALPSALRKRAVVIPNFFEELVEPQTSISLPSRSIVALGRLHQQKRFDLLIRGFAAAGAAGWTLWIFGDGPERANLERLVQEFGLADRVRFPGLTQSPRTLLRQAEIVAISSDYEGMSVVLLEALSVGAAILTTDFIGDPRNVVNDGQSAIIVPRDDVDALGAAILKLASSKDLRQALGEKALVRAVDFSADMVGVEWLKLLQSLSRNENAAR